MPFFFESRQSFHFDHSQAIKEAGTPTDCPIKRGTLDDRALTVRREDDSIVSCRGDRIFSRRFKTLVTHPACRDCHLKR